MAEWNWGATAVGLTLAVAGLVWQWLAGMAADDVEGDDHDDD